MNENAKSREEIVQLFRDYQKKVTGWLSQKIGFWKKDDDYTNSEEYKAALKAYQEFKPQVDVDYTPVIEYARDLYDRYDKSDSALDEKADSIIRYLGGGSALITFGALVSIRADIRENRELGIVVLVCLLPSLLSAVVAVYSAIRVRQPRSAAILPNVDFAKRMAEFYTKKEDIELNIYLMYSPICEAAHFRSIKKARWLSLAHIWYCVSIVTLLFPIVGISICLARM